MALDVTNSVNVEATLNNWFNSQITGLTKPSWLPSFTVVFDEPEQAISTPSVSVYHLGGTSRKRYQGNRVGEGKTGAAAFGLMDVSCWVSRQDSVSGQAVWAAQLRTLRAYVGEVFAGVTRLALVDYFSDPNNPTNSGYTVRFGDLEYQSTAPDPNPDIERARYLIRYDWTLRGSNS